MWIVIKIKDPSCVYEWRLQVSYCIGILSQQLYVLFLSKNSYSISPTSLTIPAKKLQAEIAMRAEGKPGMSDEEVCIPYHIHLIQEHPSCFLPSIIFDCWKNCQNSGSGFWGFCRYKTLFPAIYQHTMLTFPHSTLKDQTGRTRSDFLSSKSMRGGILFS